MCMLWMLWLLLLHPALAAATRPLDQQQQQHAMNSPVTPHLQTQQHLRVLLADTKLYCNITSECKPCLPKHMDSEACRPTAYTEHLTCSTNESHQHETTLTIRRRLSPRTTLLHVSRSCRAPAEVATTSTASASSSSSSSSNDTGSSSTRELPLSEQVMQHGSSSSSSEDSSSEANSNAGNVALSGAAKAVHLNSLSAVGGLNLLYFELAMLVILSGALPVVYVRKRRYVRL